MRIIIKSISIFTLAGLLLNINIAEAQNIGVNTDEPDNSALLEVYSTNKGILIPRLTTAERNDIPSPAIGLIIYNISTDKFNFWDGDSWEKINDKFISSIIGNGPHDNGGMSINNADHPPDPSAMLDINSYGTDKKGLLIPRTAPGAINSPTESLLIYNIDNNKLSFYDGTGWQSFCHETISTTTGSSNFTSDGTGINTSSVDASARLELNGTDKGLLIPRMSASNRDNIISPATGLMLYNTTDKSVDVYTGTEWHQLMYEVPAQPATINGNTTVCENATGETYSIFSVNGATSYTWTVPSGATITDGQGTTELTVDFDTVSGNICVTANNGCGSSNPACESISVEVCDSSPCAGYEGNTYDYEVVYDGYTYELVEIGDQCWFAENLRYDNGCSSATWVNYSDEGWCGCYNNNCATYIDTYGMLYQWSAAMNGSTSEGAQGLCPPGWHIPTDDECKTLEMTLGMTQTEADETGYRGTNEGSQLAGNASLWDTGVLTSNGAFGSSGFKQLPAGSRGYTTGLFYHLGSQGQFVTSTETSSTNRYPRTIKSDETGIGRSDYPKSAGISVRCLRD